MKNNRKTKPDAAPSAIARDSALPHSVSPRLASGAIGELKSDVLASGELMAEMERRATRLAEKEKWGQAARLLMRAARLEPLQSARWLQIALWQRLNRQPQVAVKTLLEALRFNSGHNISNDVEETFARRGEKLLVDGAIHAKKKRKPTRRDAATRIGADPHSTETAPIIATSARSVDVIATEVQRRELAVLWQALGEAQLEAQDWNGCIDACRALLDLEPRHHFGREMLATALLHSGRIDEAATVMHELLLLSPRDPLHRLKFATLLQLQGKSGASSREFQRVADSHPDAPFVGEAHDAIETLDHIQIQQVLMRAGTESMFREQLESAFEAALPDNGFHLSEAGRESLRHILGDGSPDYGSAAPPRIH